MGESPAASPQVPAEGDVVVVTIEGLGYRGEGYAQVAPGRFVSVPHTLAGDQVTVRVGPWRRGRAWAELVEVLERSPQHAEPDCPYFSRCSGCSLRHVSRDGERELKLAAVREIVERYAPSASRTLGAGEQLPVDWVAEAARLGHRRRGRFAVAVVDGVARLGLGGVDLARTVVDVRGCPAQVPRFVEVARHLGDLLDGDPEVAASLESVEIVVGSDARVVVMVVGSEVGRQALDRAASELEGVSVVGATDPATVSLESGVVAPLSSWIPVNPGAARLMVEWVTARIDAGHRHVLDLCCGLGTVTTALAPHYSVLAIDRDHRATRALEAAALPGVKVRTGAVAKVLRKLRREVDRPAYTAAVVNPMRKPLGQELDDLAHLGTQQVIYLGPSPVSACRDAERLAQRHGFALARIACVDLHPGTSQFMVALDLHRQPIDGTSRENLYQDR